MIQNNWQHQPNLHSSSSNNGDVDDQQQLHHDIFGNSTKRPISAPPASNEDLSFVNGLGSTKYSSSSSANLKTWGDDDDNDDDNNNHFHLSNKLFNFQNDKVLQENSRQFNKAPPGILFPSENTSLSSSNHSLYEDFDVMQIGSRRPASTGVIGQNSRIPTSSAVMDSLGLISTDGTKRKQKPIMDLIEEDFPKNSPSPEYHQDDLLSGASFHSHHQFRSATAAPSHHVSSIQYDAQNQHYQHNQNSFITSQRLGSQNNQNNSLSSMNGSFDNHNFGQQQHNLFPNHIERSSQVETGFFQDTLRSPSQHSDKSRFEGSYQATAAPPPSQNKSIHPHQHLINQQQSFEHHPMYYNMQRPELVSNPHHQLNINTQNSAPVYVNATPFGGGYTTLQYHHQGSPQHFHHQNPVVIQAHDLQRYISAIPVQGTVAAQVPTNGAFIYFQQPPNAPNINIMNTSENSNSMRNQSKGNNKSNNNGKKNGRGKVNVSNDNNGKVVSAVLEEFRCDKNQSKTAFDIKGYIVEFCQDQNGSRFIQQRLEMADEAEKNFILSEIIPEINKLRIDIFGNYVIQKLFDFGTSGMIKKVKETISGDMLSLSKQMYGCRVVQKALEIVGDEDLLELLSELHGSMLTCIHDQNGNHVIQKYIEIVCERTKKNTIKGDINMVQRFKQETNVVFNCVTEDVRSLACHPYGCRVFQRILEYFDENQKSRVLNSILEFHQYLLDDQYGNYVIQHVLRFGRTVDRDSVLKIVIQNSLLNLSKQKFASNVVEKLLKFGNDRHRRAIVKEMLKKVKPNNGSDSTRSTEESSVVLMMVRDAYANYVVQTTLDVVPEGEEKQMLFEELNSNASLLRNFTFAKHIIAKLESNS